MVNLPLQSYPDSNTFTYVDRLAVFAIPVQIGVSKFETSALKLNTMSTLTAALAKF